MRACWLKWVGRDWSISADYIWLNYSGANIVSTANSTTSLWTPFLLSSERRKWGRSILTPFSRATFFIKSIKNLWASANCSSLLSFNSAKAESTRTATPRPSPSFFFPSSLTSIQPSNQCAARAIAFCDRPDARSLRASLALILLAMLYLLGLGCMDSRNVPGGRCRREYRRCRTAIFGM